MKRKTSKSRNFEHRLSPILARIRNAVVCHNYGEAREMLRGLHEEIFYSDIRVSADRKKIILEKINKTVSDINETDYGRAITRIEKLWKDQMLHEDLKRVKKNG